VIVNDKLGGMTGTNNDGDFDLSNQQFVVGEILIPEMPNKTLFQIAVIEFAIEKFGWEVENWEPFRASLISGVCDENALEDFDILFIEGVEWISWSFPDHLDIDESNNQLVVVEFKEK
jgi:hypothetical protein